MTKIKFALFTGEVRNCWAKVIKVEKYYQLYFDDGKSYDLQCEFDQKRRCFHGT